MKTKTLCFLMLFAGISIVLIAIARGGNMPVNENNLDELKARLGEAWSIVAERIDGEYINKEIKRLNERETRVRERVADGYLSEETGKGLSEYYELKRNFLKSRYFVVNRELVIIPEPVKLSDREEKEVKLINKALADGEGKWAVQDGAKVVVDSDEEHYIVIFEIILPEGVIGADFAAKVFFNKKTGEIVRVWGAS